jgi:hypothetical protein
VRGAVAFLLLAGCFAPSAPQGIACDPLEPSCPAGQQCYPTVDGYACSKNPTVGDPDAAGVDASDIDAMQLDASPGSIQKTYMATVAECIAPMLPSPMFCRMKNGNTEMVVDLKDSMTNEPWHAYIRFDIDGALAGKMITKVTLRLMTTTDAKAPGPNSGSIYRVEQFTLASLSMTTPATMGAEIGAAKAPIAANTAYTWVLPSSLVTANGAVYLGVLPNVTDGVNYYNTSGATPPRLIVDAQ